MSDDASAAVGGSASTTGTTSFDANAHGPFVHEPNDNTVSASMDLVGGTAGSTYLGIGAEASYCYRLMDKLCLDGGGGILGAYGFKDDLSLVSPNLHLGATFYPFESIGAGLRAHLGYAQVSGSYAEESAQYTRIQEYSERGLLYEGGLRLVWDATSHFGVHGEFSFVSLPAGNKEDRATGLQARIGTQFMF